MENWTVWQHGHRSTSASATHCSLGGAVVGSTKALVFFFCLATCWADSRAPAGEDGISGKPRANAFVAYRKRILLISSTSSSDPLSRTNFTKSVASPIWLFISSCSTIKSGRDNKCSNWVTVVFGMASRIRAPSRAVGSSSDSASNEFSVSAMGDGESGNGRARWILCGALVTCGDSYSINFWEGRCRYLRKTSMDSIFE